jgi:Flp pilus assembly protein TadD
MWRSFLLQSVLFVGCVHSPLPEDALRHNREGVMLLKEGRLAEAQAHFELALEYRPRFAEARVNLGVVFLERGEDADAEACFRRALSDDPDLALARSNLGVSLERRGEPTQAMGAYRAAIAIDPAVYEARFNLARLLMMHDEPREAWRELMRLHVQHPEEIALLGALVLVEVRLGELEHARARIAEAASREETHPLMHLARGLVHAHDGELDEAVISLELARRDPALAPIALSRLAVLHRLAGRAEEAEAAARLLPPGSLVRAVSFAPTAP